MKKITINAVYNSLYQAIMYIFPLFVAAYLGRVLSTDGVGKVSFIQNIVSYFVAIVPLGIPTYGTREIAKCRDSYERNSIFTNLFLINAALDIFMCSYIWDDDFNSTIF